MKKIYYMLLAMLALSFTFTACSNEEPFSTATADDEPRILDPIFPDRVNENLPVIVNINRNANLVMKLTVTPADYTTVVWQIDGNEVQTGTVIDTNLKAGTYKLKVTVSTGAGKSTYREGMVQVNPLPGDPWSTTIALERIIAPNTKARLYGDNLNNVENINIDGKSITAIAFVKSEGGNYLEYDAPGDLSEGEHRVLLVDGEGNAYGANTVNVVKSALVTSGADRTKANATWVMNGLNLDQIASLTIGGQTISTFTRQSATEIAFICPELADGEYPLTGKTKSGSDVQFYNKAFTAEYTTQVSSKTVLWEGHHYVSWDLPDESPNKVFKLIGKDVFARIKAGATLSISYSIASEAAYHKMQTTTGHWVNLPGTTAVEFTENGTLNVQLTQEALDMIQVQDGFLCVGHGYYVDLVTVE